MGLILLGYFSTMVTVLIAIVVSLNSVFGALDAVTPRHLMAKRHAGSVMASGATTRVKIAAAERGDEDLPAQSAAVLLSGRSGPSVRIASAETAASVQAASDLAHETARTARRADQVSRERTKAARTTRDQKRQIAIAASRQYRPSGLALGYSSERTVRSKVARIFARFPTSRNF